MGAAVALLTECERFTDAMHAAAPRAHLLQGPSAKPTPAAAAAANPDDASPETPRVACPSQVDPLEESARALESKSYEVALSCAEDAILEDPESAPAQQARGAALVALDRADEARLAYTHALALDPDDPEILSDAADLYLSHGKMSHEIDEIALEYARRGERRARRRRPDLVERLDVLEGMALNDLGRSPEALAKLGEALDRDPKDLDARYEHAAALFELCRFTEARTDLRRVLGELPDDAYAHHELGLTLERLGESRAAAAELEKASALDAEAFPPSPTVPMAEFKQMVAEAVQALPAPLKADLAQVTLSVEEMPDVADLTVDPPLSPTILGLFRGEPLGAEADGGGDPEDPRAILLYRRNLVRMARSRDELKKQVQVTLWHELGHLRGADDDQLRLRGLE